MTISKLMRATALSTAILGASIGAANASLTIIPGGVADQQDVINDLGGNVPPAGLPLGLTGYTPQNFPPGPAIGPNLIANDAGLYTFTYLGSGNAIDHDIISIAGGLVTFDNTVNSFGDTATVFLPAGEIFFTYTDVSTGASTTSSSPNSPAIAYFLGLAGSSHCINTTDPNVVCDGVADALTGPGTDAYIGLADQPWALGIGIPAAAPDHDFQDLGVLVHEAPEPASMALLGAGLAGLGMLRRKKA